MSSGIPKAFISYSHDTQEHKKWVLELAIRLRNNGIDAILDQFELKPGDDIPHFMETNLATADKVLMVCTNNYVEKANKGEGGVGYEKMIVTSSLLKRINENKVIPIIRQVGTTDVPTFLMTKLYVNFSRPDDFEFSYDELVRTIHNSPLFAKPAVGNNPFKPIEKEKLDGDIELLHKVILGILSENNKGYSSASLREIGEFVNISIALVSIGVIKLKALGYVSEYSGISLTDKGKLYAYENGLIT